MNNSLLIVDTEPTNDACSPLIFFCFSSLPFPRDNWICPVKSPECLASHLASLLLSAEHRLNEVGGTGSTQGTSSTSFLDATSARASFSAAHNNLTGCGGNTEDKQVALRERKVRTLRKMLLGFDQASSYHSLILSDIYRNFFHVYQMNTGERKVEERDEYMGGYFSQCRANLMGIKKIME